MCTLCEDVIKLFHANVTTNSTLSASENIANKLLHLHVANDLLLLTLLPLDARGLKCDGVWNPVATFLV